MDNFNKLIAMLTAVANYSKDIHYTVVGSGMYGKHLLADRVQENIYDYIDSIKEVCFLGRGEYPLPSASYLGMAIEHIPSIEADDYSNYTSLQLLLVSTLKQIEDMSRQGIMTQLSQGETNLLGGIAENLQNSLGLVTLQVTRPKQAEKL